MKVFYSKPNSSYSGGIVLVAANTQEEALKVAASNIESAFSDYDYETGREIQTYNTYYEWSVFQEVAGLVFDTDTPKVILYNFYAE